MLYTGTYTRRRAAARAIDGATGRPSASVWSDTSIAANVQPLSPEMLARMPEGMRARDPKLVLTNAELHVIEVAANRPADRIVIDGSEYEVESVERFNRYLPHYEAVALRVAAPAP